MLLLSREPYLPPRGHREPYRHIPDIKINATSLTNPFYYGLLDNIEKYKEIDSKMRDKIINIVSIASDLKHVFDMATTSQKSALLKLLLKDCKLNGKTLEYELNKPFDMLFSCSDYNQWSEIAVNNIDAFERIEN